MPIVEPEVLPDGDHDLETAQRVTEEVSEIQPFLEMLHEHKPVPKTNFIKWNRVEPALC